MNRNILQCVGAECSVTPSAGNLVTLTMLSALSKGLAPQLSNSCLSFCLLQSHLHKLLCLTEALGLEEIIEYFFPLGDLYLYK